MEGLFGVAANLGVGAFLATLIFVFAWRTVRSLSEQQREDRQLMENRLSAVTDAYNKTTQENTRILAEIYTWLRIKNGHKD